MTTRVTPVRRKTRVVPNPSTWQRASRAEMYYLVAYFGLVVALTDILNVRLGVELMTLVTAVAGVFITRLPWAFFRDWWFVLVGLIMWNLSGPIAHYSPFPLHLDFMLNIDRALFFGHVPAAVAQQYLTHGQQLNVLDWLTAAAYNMHVPEPYIVGYFLWRLNRGVYLQFAAAAIVLLVLGFITFILFPAVPPWMASTRLGRISGVINRFGLVLAGHPLPFHGTPLFVLFPLRGDAVAAFPSEHAAFPLLEFLALRRCVPRGVRVLMALWILWVLFTIIYLGEHWVTDALAGYVFALVIWTAIRSWTERGARLVSE